MSAWLDVQAVQGVSGQRGIGRYVLELAQAMERWHPERVSGFLLNPDLPVPRRLVEALSGSGRLAFHDQVAAPAGSVFHLASPLEESLSSVTQRQGLIRLQRLWPKRFREMRLVVTLFDLIPLRWPEFYVAGHQGAYQTRLNLFRVADRVIAISQASAQDAINLLGLRPERVVVAGAGVAEHFRPARDRGSALRTLQERRASITAGYILYTGGGDHRKNIDGLLVAYAGLPQALRSRHQLVIVGRLSVDERNTDLRERLEELNISNHVVLLGFVPDDELVLLYQAAELFVFPSLYEGFGLPVLEALACGTPAIAGRNSSLLELIENEEALFDASDAPSIRAALKRSLTDEGLRARLRESKLAEGHTWRKTAQLTAAVYEELAATPRRARPRKPRIAYVAPALRKASDETEEIYGLLGALRRRCHVDTFFDEALGAGQPSGPGAYRLAGFEAAEEVRGGYDAVLYWLGDAHWYAGALELLRRRSGVVLARDVRLTVLYSWCASARPGMAPGGFDGAVSSRLPVPLGENGRVDQHQADRDGVLMAREVITLSQRFFVRSEREAQLARLDARSEDADKVSVLPSWPGPGASNDPLWQVPGLRYVRMAERLHREILLLSNGVSGSWVPSTSSEKA